MPAEDNVVRLSFMTGQPGHRKSAAIDTETGEIVDPVTGKSIGKSIADLANETDWDLRVRAPIQQLNFDDLERVDEGGNTLPLLGSTITVPGFEVGVVGQWAPGMKARLVIEVEVEDVRFQTLRDKDLGAYGMNRQHIGLKPDGVKNAAAPGRRSGR